MSWSEQQSQNRLAQQKDRLHVKPLQLSALSRKLDLGIVLSELACRRVFGAHLYVSLDAFAHQFHGLTTQKEWRRALFALHLYQGEVFRIVEHVFGDYLIRFQGSKAHIVVCQPFGDPSTIAIRVLLLQQVLLALAADVFQPLFPQYCWTSLSSGADLGHTIATRNGRKKNRELLFLGSPANYAAKIMQNPPSLRLTDHLYELLPREIRLRCQPEMLPAFPNRKIYDLPPMESTSLSHLLMTSRISWNVQTSRAVVQHEQKMQNVAACTIGPVRKHIDVPTLSIRNSKHVLAASLFADISGYTHYIEQAEETHQKIEALHVLHAIRREMTMIVQDYGGIHIQFQGDRVQALFYRPRNDEQAIALQAVQAAIALQSFVEGPLKRVFPAAKPLHFAIGIALGETVVSRVGVRAQRDVLCLGEAIEQADALEEACAGTQIGISERVYKVLPPLFRKYFQYKEKQKGYIASGLTYDQQKDLT